VGAIAPPIFLYLKIICATEFQRGKIKEKHFLNDCLGSVETEKRKLCIPTNLPYFSKLTPL